MSKRITDIKVIKSEYDELDGWIGIYVTTNYNQTSVRFLTPACRYASTKGYYSANKAEHTLKYKLSVDGKGYIVNMHNPLFTKFFIQTLENETE